MSLRTRPDTEIAVTTRGEVTLAAPDYARTKLLAVLARLDEPVLAVRVKLTQEPHHAVAEPSIAQATVDLNGRPVRAHVAAANMQEAVDLLQERLQARIARLRGRRGHGRTAERTPTGREHRPQRRELDGEDRRIVRHKSYALARRTTWEAVLEMEAMDYDFHLYTDATTGCDSVVHHDGAAGAYRIATAGAAPQVEPDIPASHHAGPELTVAEAVRRLDLTGLPFVFFTDGPSGRGSVLYHRYDGHYGLITPAR
ncbi:HPF/RaiA family ribosome-associated protein [Streptomyces sp. TLI_171]|uniref:ribosome hibernation promotion factor n=1 Tax=Streptomyces sp. TLI_171 TaxID=1938859 RepID=UPI000C18C605|nr:HPF/RaiA family ribosome-associated protein [Streptomyces sp. TLI_171]RKE05068.1 ribosome-associated translation inhibitor RaiA [Streptomyces sp. TLI_171]